MSQLRERAHPAREPTARSYRRVKIAGTLLFALGRFVAPLSLVYSVIYLRRSMKERWLQFAVPLQLHWGQL